MPFPLAKLAYMAIRQLAKPVAARIKTRAKVSPFLRNYILLPPAQLYHRFEVDFKMRILGMGKVKDVKPLNEASAIDLAADMLGEMVIFTVGAGCIYLEYRRQMNRDQNKEDVQNTRLRELEQTIRDMGLQMEEQSARLMEINRILAAQPTPRVIKDPKSGTVLEVAKR